MSPSLPPPLKRFGQNFLIDQNIVRKIIDLAAIRPDETVLEIGPGRGILTRALCAKAQKVIAIEIDRQLAQALAGDSSADPRNTGGVSADQNLPPLTACRNLDLRVGDALAFDYGSLPPDTVVVANLPYYVSTPLLFTLLESSKLIDRLILMLQTEVAHRLAARPGTKEYGALSVLTQYRAAVTLAFRVSPQCFRPRPTVGSAVVHLRLRRDGLLDCDREKRFVRLVRSAFAHRRKTVLNSLRDERCAPDMVAAALAECGIAPDRRAETLSLEDYLRLAAALIEGDAEF
ncbi:MAG TPA: 16S rRNA (adenine(1518)-N(6)/adenine(1519)-N(6))-dimethyltransferase RsmA [Nitrospiraceae bacterium]|nr:16S rRNA (adenine(1518)-N(6)/adenine(1519)-N(6))-dimethyltransferase RsmA [Nitrospiraceae bacterium]